MPFFRYQCNNCGHEFRHLHLESIDDDVACPECNSTDLQRKLPRVAVQFKGSGYYKTDRANKKSKAGTKGLSDKDASSETKPRPSSDDKPGTSSDSD